MESERRERRRRWVVPVWAAVGLLAVAAMAAWLARSGSRTTPSSPLAALAAAARGETRLLEPRLSGFEWAPYRGATRSAEASDLRLASVAGESLARLSADPSPAARREAAIAHLLEGRPREAMAMLEPAAEQLRAPGAFSDLAAVMLEGERRFGAIELLSGALAAADRALALDPKHAEASFNRALVLERLGLRDDAREAWDRYLTLDPAGGWSGEARQRRETLAPVPPFLELLDRDYDRIAGDKAAARELARSDPFGARGMGTRDVLGRWGAAALRGDERDASRHLSVARNLGAALEGDGGDRTLARAVAAIDAASADARTRLASAHSDYLAGMLAFGQSGPGDAEPLLRRAAAAFAREGSPMELPARSFAANALFEEGRADEAEREQESLLGAVPADFPAYRAFFIWQLGIYRTARGEWGEAIVRLEEAAAGFESLNESENVAAVRRMLAFVHDRIGDRETASKQWLATLRGVGRRSALPLLKAVESIADDAIVRRDWHTATSFLGLQAAISGRLRDDVGLASSLFIRAAVRARMNDAAGAEEDIAQANLAAARIDDAVYRQQFRRSEMRARAMLPRTSPTEAAALLTRALEEVGNADARIELPGVLLERARVRRASGDAEGAAADLERGIAELERQRESLPRGELRWGAFHAAGDLFEEAIDLALARGDVEGAFHLSEEARARSLLDVLGGAPVVDFRHIPAGTTIVEYAALPSRLVIFTADASGVRATAVPLDRESLAKEVESLTHALKKGSSAASERAWRMLLAPVEPHIAGAETLVIVPEATTSAVAFSALAPSRGEYLVQRQAIVVAPSAAAYLAIATRRRPGRAPSSALVISSTAVAGSGTLASVEREAARIADVYARGAHVSDGETTVEEMFARAARAEVLHFAGHAVGDPRGFEPASIILRQEGEERRIRVDEIAKLRLPRTGVVVLAGCNTARGERRAAEGVISVAYGFLTSGPPSVIATLWPIEDAASAVFFPRVHQRLAEGLTPAEALRGAQIESIRRGDVPLSLWAAVQDIGN